MGSRPLQPVLQRSFQDGSRSAKALSARYHSPSELFDRVQVYKSALERARKALPEADLQSLDTPTYPRTRPRSSSSKTKNSNTSLDKPVLGDSTRRQSLKLGRNQPHYFWFVLAACVLVSAFVLWILVAQYYILAKIWSVHAAYGASCRLYT